MVNKFRNGGNKKDIKFETISNINDVIKKCGKHKKEQWNHLRRLLPHCTFICIPLYSHQNFLIWKFFTLVASVASVSQKVLVSMASVASVSQAGLDNPRFEYPTFPYFFDRPNFSRVSRCSPSVWQPRHIEFLLLRANK